MDEHVQGRDVTIRRFHHEETGEQVYVVVFVGGWRVGTYRTEKGAIDRVRREIGDTYDPKVDYADVLELMEIGRRVPGGFRLG